MSRSNQYLANNFIQSVLDVILILVVYFASYQFSSGYTNLIGVEQYLWILFFVTPVWLLMLVLTGLYEKILYYSYEKVLSLTVLSAVMTLIFLATSIFFIKETIFNRTLYFGFAMLFLTSITISKFAFKFMMTRDHAMTNMRSRVVIVGIPKYADNFIKEVQRSQRDINILGYIFLRDHDSNKGKKILGDMKDLEQIIKDNAVDEVIFALPQNYIGEVEKYVLMCEEMGLTVRMLLNMYDLKIAKTYLTNFGTLPMLTFDSVSLNRLQMISKRIIDIAGAVVGICITGFISVFVVIAIKMDSPGPVIFAQNRVGLNGRKFMLYKFRSMCNDAEFLKDQLEVKNEFGDNGLMFKIKNDPRITKVGNFLRKTSLDELPQFINVLKGDMSLVGTRPPTVKEVEKYKNYHRRRISIKPGLTGLWQVSGRSEIQEFDDVVKLDTKYIDEWSIWLDIKIILKTFAVVFKRKGAC
jgi:exopolysaccharide biosynthesis polyprenyl glycosylphosphotransferase